MGTPRRYKNDNNTRRKLNKMYGEYVHGSMKKHGYKPPKGGIDQRKYKPYGGKYSNTAKKDEENNEQENH